ncbi:Peptidase M48 domain-containing protein [Nostoc sp. DSM 114161]|jgi:hypothetical protein|uniref:hypothetical protein n=1 Tax=Nostoc sp. DSM 114161 TaxID=3440143 RepID=UPI0040464147
MILKQTDAFNRGRDYLRLVQGFALEPGMVDVFDNLRDRIAICTWIGKNINSVNAAIDTYLDACHQCFHPQERRHIQIFAVPIAQSFGIDGLCNILTNPITILVDVGRVAPKDWFGIVVHEYAHAHLGDYGHNQQFANILSHLCLGLGLEPPLWEAGMEATLRSWPYCQPTIDPLEFWIGNGSAG